MAESVLPDSAVVAFAVALQPIAGTSCGLEVLCTVVVGVGIDANKILVRVGRSVVDGEGQKDGDC